VAWALALGAALAASPGGAKEGRPRKAAEARKATTLAGQRSPSSADTLSLDLGGVSLELVRVPAGEFRQGSPPAERGRNSDEKARAVSLSEDYYLGQYEVTVAQFTAFANATGYRTEAERGSSGGFGWVGGKLTQDERFNWRAPGYAQTPQHPVGLVTFADARAFTEWLSDRTGRVVDLPTEAQWEHAYRAGTIARFYSGNADATASTIGWFQGNAPQGPHAVGELKPNALGLFDLAGNVYEWCQDWYGPYDCPISTGWGRPPGNRAGLAI
jgi:formylglycine-generating enzyme required for sulfatase activity